MPVRQIFLQISFILAAFASVCKGFSQSALSKTRVRTTQTSWQQRADHAIRVRLDEKNQFLHATQTLVYTNNSPGALTEIHMHVWPNAFRDRTTAYGRESVINGGKDFFHATDDKLGWLDSLSFTADGKPTTFTFDPASRDIIIVKLPEPLASGASITLETPFRVKIPWLFSRMGLNEGIYSITQWYPKPAVYDVNGWNTFPYAEQGEYYSEFGTYDVTLDVPANFRIAATGRLQDTAELAWLLELAEGGEDEPRTGRKALRYVQENVCDFAWFAGAEFMVKTGTTQLPGGRKVTNFAFFREKTKRPLPGGKSITMPVDGQSILKSIDKALTYYSRRVGTYPYDYCSVVIGPLQGAGGMEYPMVTICADASEGTVIHEVGHNWFQGMLGSNERRYPWMDESINTFYQNQAEGKGAEELSPGDMLKPVGSYAGYRLSHDFGYHQCGNLHSRDYTSINYGTIVYGINPQRFLYLQEFLGRNLMDSCMRAYFKAWCFRHPLPGDMKTVFEQVSRRDLSWFFKDLLGGPAPDYAIRSVRRSGRDIKVSINNKSGYRLPVKLQWRSGTKKEFMWVFNDTTVRLTGRPQQVVLNGTGYLPESNLANNDARTSGILKTWGSPVFGLPSLYKRGENRVWFFPWLFSWNRYDGWTPGLVLSNISYPRRNWEWWATPLYGRRSKEITGLAGLRRNIFHKSGSFNLTELSVNYKRFSFVGGAFQNAASPYNRLAFRATSWLKRGKPWVQQSLDFELTVVRLDRTDYLSPQFDSAGNITEYRRRFDKRTWESEALRFSYTRESKKKLMPTRIRADFRFGGNKGLIIPQSRVNEGAFLMGNIEGEAFITYPNRRKKSIGLYAKGWFSAMSHSFAGGNSGRFVLQVSAPQADPNDFTFSSAQIARSAVFGSGDGIWSNVTMAGMNGIRMFPNLNTDRLIAGVNLQSHVLPFVPLQAYIDAAYVPGSTGERLLYAGGVTFAQRIGLTTSSEVSLPLFYSQTFRDFVKLNDLRWYELVQIRLNLDLNNPFELVRNILN